MRHLLLAFIPEVGPSKIVSQKHLMEPMLDAHSDANPATQIWVEEEVELLSSVPVQLIPKSMHIPPLRGRFSFGKMEKSSI
jgi:hypothetical protein